MVSAVRLPFDQSQHTARRQLPSCWHGHGRADQITRGWNTTHHEKMAGKQRSTAESRHPDGKHGPIAVEKGGGEEGQGRGGEGCKVREGSGEFFSHSERGFF